MSFDQQVEVFSAQTLGWQIDIAGRCMEIFPHSGFAVLAIIMSYFENIAKFREDYVKKDKSKFYFKEGMKWMFPILGIHPAMERTLDTFYDQVRSNLYHASLTGPGVMLDGSLHATLIIAPDGLSLIINPKTLVTDIRGHFAGYVGQLRDPANTELRENFSRRYSV